MPRGLGYARTPAAAAAPGGGQDIRAATLIVGAVDSVHPNAADYTCDGVADDVQINAALNALPASGGRVVLLDGTFQINDSITIPINGVTLQGQGHGTYIDGSGLVNNEHAIVVSGREDVVLRDMVIYTEPAIGLTRHCIFIEDGSDNFRVERIWIDDSDTDGIHIEGTTIHTGHIADCTIMNADGSGIFVDMDAGNVIHRLQIQNCDITQCGVDGIRFDPPDILYASVQGNVCHNCDGAGIRAFDTELSEFSGNVCYANGLYGMSIGGGGVTVDGNICYLNQSHGILFDDLDRGVCSNNISIGNDWIFGGNFDGIHIDDDSDDCIISDNYCYANGRHGILADGWSSVVEGNRCQYNGLHGIYVDCVEALIEGNYCHNNSQHTEETYHGICLSGSSSYSSVNGNYLGNPDQGGVQEDGIHIETFCHYVLIEGNFCETQLGSGIALADDSDRCTIHDNYCATCGDYGIEIANANALGNSVKDNRLINNGAGAFLDNGTNTATHELWEVIGFPDAVHGGRPIKELPDAADTHAYVTLQLPMGFQELVTASFVLIAEADGNAVFTVDTTFGKICAGEQQDTHTDAIAATLLAMTNDELECFPLNTGLDGIVAGDNIGVDLMRDGDHVGDELEATVNAVGIRLRYV